MKTRGRRSRSTSISYVLCAVLLVCCIFGAFGFVGGPLLPGRLKRVVDVHLEFKTTRTSVPASDSSVLKPPALFRPLHPTFSTPLFGATTAAEQGTQHQRHGGVEDPNPKRRHPEQEGQALYQGIRAASADVKQSAQSGDKKGVLYALVRLFYRAVALPFRVANRVFKALFHAMQRTEGAAVVAPAAHRAIASPHLHISPDPMADAAKPMAFQANPQQSPRTGGSRSSPSSISSSASSSPLRSSSSDNSDSGAPSSKPPQQSGSTNTNAVGEKGEGRDKEEEMWDRLESKFESVLDSFGAVVTSADGDEDVIGGKTGGGGRAEGKGKESEDGGGEGENAVPDAVGDVDVAPFMLQSEAYMHDGDVRDRDDGGIGGRESEEGNEGGAGAARTGGTGEVSERELMDYRKPARVVTEDEALHPDQGVDNKRSSSPPSYSSFPASATTTQPSTDGPSVGATADDYPEPVAPPATEDADGGGNGRRSGVADGGSGEAAPDLEEQLIDTEEPGNEEPADAVGEDPYDVAPSSSYSDTAPSTPSSPSSPSTTYSDSPSISSFTPSDPSSSTTTPSASPPPITTFPRTAFVSPLSTPFPSRQARSTAAIERSYANAHEKDGEDNTRTRTLADTDSSAADEEESSGSRGGLTRVGEEESGGRDGDRGEEVLYEGAIVGQGAPTYAGGAAGDREGEGAVDEYGGAAFDYDPPPYDYNDDSEADKDEEEELDNPIGGGGPWGLRSSRTRPTDDAQTSAEETRDTHAHNSVGEGERGSVSADQKMGQRSSTRFRRDDDREERMRGGDGVEGDSAQRPRMWGVSGTGNQLRDSPAHDARGRDGDIGARGRNVKERSSARDDILAGPARDAAEGSIASVTSDVDPEGSGDEERLSAVEAMAVGDEETDAEKQQEQSARNLRTRPRASGNGESEGEDSGRGSVRDDVLARLDGDVQEGESLSTLTAGVDPADGADGGEEVEGSLKMVDGLAVADGEHDDKVLEWGHEEKESRGGAHSTRRVSDPSSAQPPHSSRSGDTDRHDNDNGARDDEETSVRDDMLKTSSDGIAASPSLSSLASKVFPEGGVGSEGLSAVDSVAVTDGDAGAEKQEEKAAREREEDERSSSAAHGRRDGRGGGSAGGRGSGEGGVGEEGSVRDDIVSGFSRRSAEGYLSSLTSRVDPEGGGEESDLSAVELMAVADADDSASASPAAAAGADDSNAPISSSPSSTDVHDAVDRDNVAASLGAYEGGAEPETISHDRDMYEHVKSDSESSATAAGDDEYAALSRDNAEEKGVSGGGDSNGARVDGAPYEAPGARMNGVPYEATANEEFTEGGLASDDVERGGGGGDVDVGMDAGGTDEDLISTGSAHGSVQEAADRGARDDSELERRDGASSSSSPTHDRHSGDSRDSRQSNDDEEEAAAEALMPSDPTALAASSPTDPMQAMMAAAASTISSPSTHATDTHTHAHTPSDSADGGRTHPESADGGRVRGGVGERGVEREGEGGSGDDAERRPWDTIAAAAIEAQAVERQQDEREDGRESSSPSTMDMSAVSSVIGAVAQAGGVSGSATGAVAQTVDDVPEDWKATLPPKDKRPKKVILTSTEKEMAAVRDIQEKLAPLPSETTAWVTEQDILRYLRACGANEAWKRLKGTITWRQQVGVDELVKRDYSGHPLRGELFWLAERDHEGNPVLVFRTKEHVPGKYPNKEYIEYLVHTLETGRRQYGIGRDGVKISVLADRVGAGLKQQDPMLISELIPMLLTHFPGTLSSAYVAPLNWFLYIILAVFRAVVDADTANRLHLIQGDYKKQMKKFIDERSLPKHLGGKLDEYWRYTDDEFTAANGILSPT